MVAVSLQSLNHYTTFMLNFKHSGNTGDIIYSLPSIKKVCEDKGERATLYIQLGVVNKFADKHHPVGNVQMNQTMFDMLHPLLIAQPYINNVICYNNEGIPKLDYDLDKFRVEFRNLSAGNISLWYNMVYPELRPDLHLPSLKVIPKPNDYIIVNRSARYNNLFINYSMLKEYDNVYFVGVKREFETLAVNNSKLNYLEVSDFYELASYIAGCKLFIGNQSMAFSIAEQLKVKRIIESHYLCPNVIPCGGEYYNFQTNEQFKNILEHINGEYKNHNRDIGETQTSERP